MKSLLFLCLESVVFNWFIETLIGPYSVGLEKASVEKKHVSANWHWRSSISPTCYMLKQQEFRVLVYRAQVKVEVACTLDSQTGRAL